MADGRDVDAGREQVDRDGDAGLAFVLEAGESVWSTWSAAPVILQTAASLYCSIVLGQERGVEQALDHVGMGVGSAEDQCLLFAEGVEFVGQLLRR